MPIWTRSQSLRQKEIEIEPNIYEENLWSMYRDMNVENISDEQIQEAQQDPKFQKFMERLLGNDRDKYLLMLKSHGARIIIDFNKDQPRKMHNRAEAESNNNINNPLNALTQQIQNLQQQMQDIQRGTTRRYNVEDICPYPFDRSIIMPCFPPNSDIPKYDKIQWQN